MARLEVAFLVPLAMRIGSLIRAPDGLSWCFATEMNPQVTVEGFSLMKSVQLPDSMMLVLFAKGANKPATIAKSEPI